MRIPSFLCDLALLAAPSAIVLTILTVTPSFAAERVHQSDIPWDARCAARAYEPGGIQDSGYCRTLAARTFGCTPIFARPVRMTHPDSRVHTHRGAGTYWACDSTKFQRGLRATFARFGG